MDTYFIFDDWCQVLVTLLDLSFLLTYNTCIKPFSSLLFLLQNTIFFYWEIFTFYPSRGRKVVAVTSSISLSELVRWASNHGAERSKYITISVCHILVIQFYHWIYKGLVYGPLTLINLLKGYPTPFHIYYYLNIPVDFPYACSSSFTFTGQHFSLVCLNKLAQTHTKPCQKQYYILYKGLRKNRQKLNNWKRNRFVRRAIPFLFALWISLFVQQERLFLLFTLTYLLHAWPTNNKQNMNYDVIRNVAVYDH